MNKAYKIILNELTMVGKNSISLKEVGNRVLTGYTREYETKEIIISSFRIDNVISKLLGLSRDKVKYKLSNGEIILNYEICNKENHLLKTNDIFSIRKHGKYKFGDILGHTKRDNYIVRIYKYIDENKNT